jgi:putative molybdenum carrier protein
MESLDLAISHTKGVVLRKIISGGKTGADHACLDFAIKAGLEHGGFVPRGRRAEDGRIPEHYKLTELSSVSYAVRTKRNVREADGTVVFSLDPILTGGSSLTIEYAAEVGKPRLHIHRAATDYDRCQRPRCERNAAAPIAGAA